MNTLIICHSCSMPWIKQLDFSNQAR